MWKIRLQSAPILPAPRFVKKFTDMNLNFTIPIQFVH